MRSETEVGMYMKITLLRDMASCSLAHSHQTARLHVAEDNIIICIRHPAYQQKIIRTWHDTGIILCEVHKDCCPSNIIDFIAMHIRSLTLHKRLNSNVWHFTLKCRVSTVTSCPLPSLCSHVSFQPLSFSVSPHVAGRHHGVSTTSNITS